MLNCDLGEGVEEVDRMVMPFIDLANIACGGHAGDEESMFKTVELASRNGVLISAHPSYPDRSNFGRVSMKIDSDILKGSLVEQIARISDVILRFKTRLYAVKPHGALYNDMMRKPDIARIVFASVAVFPEVSTLVVQDVKNSSFIQDLAKEFSIGLVYEAFGDRAYQADGLLCPRSEPGSLLSDATAIARQVKCICETQQVIATDGTRISIVADTICLHGDNPAVIEALKLIRRNHSRNCDEC